MPPTCQGRIVGFICQARKLFRRGGGGSTLQPTNKFERKMSFVTCAEGTLRLKSAPLEIQEGVVGWTPTFHQYGFRESCSALGGGGALKGRTHVFGKDKNLGTFQ